MRGRKNATATAAATPFPGYANVSELATGAFATVYKAVELGTGRAVALKVLRLADTSPHLVEVFEKELGALALLSNHPNVTTLYGTFSTPEGRPVLVLELCRESLAHRVRQSGPLSAGEVVQVGIKIAGALETAHRSGLLHRDMKPQNILVSQFDEPVLADFGVATLQAQAQSTEGVFGFTTLHAPPEALEGLPLSPSADIYGLASSMYQLLVGRGPFSSYEGEAPASVILRILRDPAPRAPANDVPVALGDLMENALAKDPAKRPQTAGDFAESLREIEALAGWAQTPYVVWGTSQALPGSAEDGQAPAATGVAVAANRATAPNPAAAQLAQLLHAETERAHRLSDPATELEPSAPAPVADANADFKAKADVKEVEHLVPPASPVPEPPAPEAPPTTQAVPVTDAPPAPHVPPTTQLPSAPSVPAVGATAKAVGAPAKARRSSSRSPKRPAEQPVPPGTRSVIAPPPQQRNVLTPLAATAQVRVVAPAELVTPVASWLNPLPGTQGAAHDRQWPLSPVAAQMSRSDRPQPSATRRSGSSGPGLHAVPGSARRQEALVLICVLLAAVVVVGGIGWAALAHLL
jgi:serine/threonine-protein kinase PknK